MSRETVVTIDFGEQRITASWAIGEQHAGGMHWDAPPRAPGQPALWASEDGHALILETLAVAHLPNVDRLVLALPSGDADTHRPRLEQRYMGLQEVRNTECRSQRLRVRVRRVCVVPHPLIPSASANAPG